MAQPNPSPAYDSELAYGDKALYSRLNSLVESHRNVPPDGQVAMESVLKEVEKFEIPIRSGRAWIVKKGQLCTLTTPHGPQVADLNIFFLHNPREKLWAARTRQLHASHVSVGDRLWSNLPYLRPLCTIVGDSLKDYGVDGIGGRVHDLLGTRCDPYVNKLLADSSFDYHCHSNLTRAVLPWGLNEGDVHDVLNVFQLTGLNRDGKYFMSACPAKPGDYFTMFAETDLLMAVSTCPGGDLSVYGWGEESAKRMLATCRPIGVEIHDIVDTRKGGKVLEGWSESIPANDLRKGYAGFHGLGMPNFSAGEEA